MQIDDLHRSAFIASFSLLRKGDSYDSKQTRVWWHYRLPFNSPVIVWRGCQGSPRHAVGVVDLTSPGPWHVLTSDPQGDWQHL